MTRKKFSLKIASIILYLAVWYNFVYLNQVDRINHLDLQLAEMRNKVNMASSAKTNLEKVRSKFKLEQDRLDEERAKFVQRKDLGKVTLKIQSLARKYDLKLVDFSPGFKDYFTQKEEKIIPLPLTITLVGRYIKIGKFVEEWEHLPFYLVPQAIIMERLDKNGYDVQAVIDSKLYTWND